MTLQKDALRASRSLTTQTSAECANGAAAPSRMDFDTTANARITELGSRISALRDERDAVLQSLRDVWTPLGRRAPFLRAAFSGVRLPIHSKFQLVEEMGGEDRVIRAPSLDGTETAVTVRDFVTAIDGFLNEVLPVADWDVLAHEILKREHRGRRGNGKRANRGADTRVLRKLGNEHMRSLLAQPERVRSAFGQAQPGRYSEAFQKRRAVFEFLLTPMSDEGRGRSVMPLYSLLLANQQWFPVLTTDMLTILAGMFAAQFSTEAKETALAKSSSAVTHLNNAEQYATQAEALYTNVVKAGSLTSSVQAANQQADAKLESANQLLAQAVADLAAAEAAAQKVTGDAAVASAVAEAQAKLEEVQNQIEALYALAQQAEAHKDVLAIPTVCLTIKCIEDDPCCDDNWSGVDVTVTNLSNPDVPPATGRTGSNGATTVCGHFGNSSVLVTTTDGGDWNETRSYTVGASGGNYTIKTDLPGIE